MGMLIQKIARQLTAVTSRPPSDRPEREADPEDGPPDAHRPGPRPPLGEGVAHDRQGDRVEHRPAEGLQAAEDDERGHARRHAAQQRPEGEQRQAGLEDAPAAEAVRHRAGRHQEAADHQGVRVDRPLQAAQRGVQPCPMAGSATLTMVASVPTISRLMQQMQRISHGRRLLVDIYLLYIYKLLATGDGHGRGRSRTVPWYGAAPRRHPGRIQDRLVPRQA